MSIFLSLKHNQTILLFLTPKNFHVLSKIAYVIMCMYLHLSSAKHYFGNRFFYSKSSSKSPLSLSRVTDLQSVCLHVWLKVFTSCLCCWSWAAKRSGTDTVQKQDATAFYLLCCRWIYLPEHRGRGFCFLNNKNTKHSLLCSGESQSFKRAVAITLWLH